MRKFCREHKVPIMRIGMRKFDTGCQTCRVNKIARLVHAEAEVSTLKVALACMAGTQTHD